MQPAFNATVFIVDDDASVREALAWLLRSRHLPSESFAGGDEFEAMLGRGFTPSQPCCLLLDVRMPGVSGLALFDKLAARGLVEVMPVIFLTGRADVPMCARAMKSGAFDFLTKPVDETVLFSAVARALERDAALRTGRAQREATELRFSTLTPREREVLTHVIAGRLNKQIAADLGTAEKTVKVHRARGMEKMHVRSVAELVRIVERAHPQGSGTSL